MKATSFRLLVVATLLLAAVVAAYSNHFDNPFHFDDSHSIVANAYLRDLGNLPLYFSDPETRSTLPTNRAYRPVLMVSFAIDYWMGGSLDPFYFHLSTFFWFLVQGIAMFFLYRKVLHRSREHAWNPLVALLIVGWYCLHTANAETINYISARSDSISTLCVVLGLLIHTHAESWKRHLAIMPVLVGILIKPTAVMYLPLVVLYDLLFVKQLSLGEMLQSRNRGAVGRVLLKILPAAVLSVALFVFTLKMTPASWAPGGTSTWSYLITQPFVIARYFWLLFVPTSLSADTDWQALASIADWRFFVGMMFLIAMASATFVTSKTRSQRPIAFGLLWFLLTLIPSSSVIALAEVTNDHRIFYPYVGLCLAVGWGAALVLMRYENVLAHSRPLKIVVGATIVTILGGHAYGTYQRNEVWGSDESLWHDVVQKSPNNGRGMMNYGLALMRRSEYKAALGYFERALETPYGRHPYLQLNTAIVKTSLGRPDEEVEAHYRRAIQTGYNYPDCHFWYAKWLADEQRRDEALAHLEVALKSSPGHVSAVELRERLIETGERAVTTAESRARDNPTPESFLELGLAYYKTGRYADCIHASREALALDPRFALAYNNICSAYNAQKMWDKAILACDRALRLTPNNELARNNRAWAVRGKSKTEVPQTE